MNVITEGWVSLERGGGQGEGRGKGGKGWSFIGISRIFLKKSVRAVDKMFHVF